ncbi:MAG TPA: DNA polymerase III subunit delta [Bryobacteraceae bacterium]|nr:DNA polymerase III subunit delta [Bryobacteraceae bacterium]
MTPDEFLRNLSARGPAPVYLFLGPEAYDRDRCRRALTEAAVPAEEREEGLIRHDLSSTELAAVLDDAQSFSLFARNRLIWVAGAEAALPRGKAVTSDDGEKKSDGGPGLLAAYLKNPAPGTTVVFDCSRYEFEGDDKARVDRVRKFYSGIPAQVDFARYSPDAARRLAGKLAREANLRIGAEELDLLVDVLAGDAARIAGEIEKLSLYAGTERAITESDIWKLTPGAKAATVFGLVGALGRKDRAAALEALDVLVREGEYLPLALSFLGTQFRLALAAKEARATGVSQVQALFTKQGIAMWRSRAEQVAQTVGAFPADRLRQALVRVYETDRALRDLRPDDRIVMERLILDVTA